MLKLIQGYKIIKVFIEYLEFRKYRKELNLKVDGKVTIDQLDLKPYTKTLLQEVGVTNVTELVRLKVSGVKVPGMGDKTWGDVKSALGLDK